jgi:Tfp pilus assembly protein PilX
VALPLLSLPQHPLLLLPVLGASGRGAGMLWLLLLLVLVLLLLVNAHVLESSSRTSA